MHIRLLRLDELPLIVAHGKEFFAEYQPLFAPATFVPEIFLDTITQMILWGQVDILGLFDGETIIGGIGLSKTPDMFDGTLMGKELFFYVQPSHRKGTTTMKILKAMKAWAQDNKIARLYLVHLHFGALQDKLERVYTHYGFTRLETTYRLVL